MACGIQGNETLKRIKTWEWYNDEVREVVRRELFSNLWAVIDLLV